MDAEAELAGFVAKFAPDIQDRIRSCRAIMAERLPRAVQLVYDNYNFLVIGFGPSERTSDAVFSLAAYARGINLFFLQGGPQLPDATGILRGSGSAVRSVRLTSPLTLRQPDVQDLIDVALERATPSMDTATGPLLIVKSVSAKQRPRQ